VPWAFGDEAVDVTRLFTKLKLELMPYLYAAGLEATATGTPVLRPMQLEFPDDPATGYLDRQYLLGADLLVAPVFTADGTVEFYLPTGSWTNYFTGETVAGGGWRTETHGFDSLPLYVRDGAAIPVGSRDDRPDYDYLDGLTLRVYPSSLPETAESTRRITVTTPSGESAAFTVERSVGRVSVHSTSTQDWAVSAANGQAVAAVSGKANLHQ
jgi:alpha-D-xyloside xylohydrolase